MDSTDALSGGLVIYNIFHIFMTNIDFVVSKILDICISYDNDAEPLDDSRVIVTLDKTRIELSHTCLGSYNLYMLCKSLFTNEMIEDKKQRKEKEKTTNLTNRHFNAKLI